MILVTGSEGLIGRGIAATLERSGIEIRRFDLRRSPNEDVRAEGAVEAALEGVRGVVHLAAVSRVLWGHKHPQLCHTTNVSALKMLVRQCRDRRRPPWLIFGSSREVYGQPGRMPVREDDPKRPMNAYARSKADGELIVEQGREAGLLANICRFSSVYGSVEDHPDRVVPAFARAAAHGGDIRIEGAMNTFDFTHIEDVVDGVLRLIHATQQGERLPPVHFVSGSGTTLKELAGLAASCAKHGIRSRETEPRPYDVSAFVGDPARAETLLDWRARIDIAHGFPSLVEKFAAEESRGGSGAKTQWSSLPASARSLVSSTAMSGRSRRSKGPAGV